MRKLLSLAVFACCLALLAPPASRADDVPTFAALRVLMANASGPEPRNYRDTIDGTGDLGPQHETTYKSGDDVRHVVDVGPIHTENGTYRSEQWHQDANGLTVIGKPRATPSPGPRTVERVSSPLDAYVITTPTGPNTGRRQYVDPQTYLVARTEYFGPRGVVTAVFERYATFDHRTLPAEWTVTDRSGAKTTYRRTYAEDVVADSDVAEPPIRRELVMFPPGTSNVELPARILKGRIYVRVAIGARTYDFMLDSGSSDIAIDAGTVHELGLTAFNRQEAIGAAGTFETRDAVIPSLQIGPLQMHDIVVTTLPNPLDQVPGELKVVGLLGFDFLATLGVTIDYQNGHVFVTRAQSYHPPQGPYVVALPVRLGSQIPTTTAAFDGAVSEHMIVDTGSNLPFVLYDDFLERNRGLLPSFGTDYVISGVKGARLVHQYPIRDLKLGRLRFANFTGVGERNSDTYPGEPDGFFGVEFLQMFTVDLDYTDGMIYLTPNDLGRRAMGSG